MILLLGGTAETAQIAFALAERGHDVLVSMATDIPLEMGKHDRIRRRSGSMGASAMATLIHAEGISLLVDAAHPYAELAHRTAQEAASDVGIGYIAYVRPPALREEDSVLREPDHERAAKTAFSTSGGKPVLLTVGSRNLVPYVKRSQQTRIAVFARVLDHSDSRRACHAAGLPDQNVIAARGPFSTAQNRALLTHLGIGTLVTKDGGEAGGLRNKIEAARETGAVVVVVERPTLRATHVVDTVEELIAKVARDI